MITAYVIRKASGLKRDPWQLFAEHGEAMGGRIGGFPTRKAAVNHASLLAGWRIPVKVETNGR